MSVVCRVPPRSVGSLSPVPRIPVVEDGQDTGSVITQQLGISWLNLLLVCRRKSICIQFTVCSYFFFFISLLLVFMWFLAERSPLVQQPEFVVNAFFTAASLLLHQVLGALLSPWDWPPSCPVSCYSFLCLLLTNQLPASSVAEKHDTLEKPRGLCLDFFLLIQHYNMYYLCNH